MALMQPLHVHTQDEDPCTRAPCPERHLCIPTRAKCLRREGCAEQQRECGESVSSSVPLSQHMLSVRLTITKLH